MADHLPDDPWPENESSLSAVLTIGLILLGVVLLALFVMGLLFLFAAL
jgi:hypothetical protein